MSPTTSPRILLALAALGAAAALALFWPDPAIHPRAQNITHLDAPSIRERDTRDLPSGETAYPLLLPSRAIEAAADSAVTGRCVSTSGQPVVNAVVTLRCPAAPGADASLGRSGPDGVFRVPTLALDVARLELRADATGYCPLVAALSLPATPAQYDIGSLRMSRGVLLHVDVRDSRDAPVPGAALEWRAKVRPGIADEYAITQTTADAAGTCAVLVPCGAVSAWVTYSPGMAPLLGGRWHVSPEETSRHVTVHCPPLACVSLRVASEDGSCVADARIVARSGPGLATATAIATALDPATGAYPLRLLCGSDAHLRVDAAGFRSCYVTVAGPPEGELERIVAIVLQRGSGELFLRPTGAPAGLTWATAIIVDAVRQIPRLVFATLDAGGCVRTQVPPTESGVKYRAIVVSQDHRWYGTTGVVAAVAGGRATVIDVHCAPVAPAPLVCINGDSQAPLGDVTVTLCGGIGQWPQRQSPWGGEYLSETGPVGAWTPLWQVRTDGEGRALLPLLPGFQCRLEATKEGFGGVVVRDVTSGEAPGTIVLTPEARIVVEQGGDGCAVGILDLAQGGRIRGADCDIEGQCVFRGLKSGEYVVGPMRDLAWIATFMVSKVDVFRSISSCAVVSVGPGETTKVRLPAADDAWVLGGVQDGMGGDVVAIDVVPAGMDAHVHSQARAAVDDEGRFQWGPVGPGRYQLRAFTRYSRGMAVACEPFELEAGRVHDVQFVASWARIRVLQGGEAQWITIDDGAMRLHAFPTNGEQTMIDLAPGEYRFEICPSRGGVRARTESVVFWEACAAGERTFDLRK